METIYKYGLDSYGLDSYGLCQRPSEAMTGLQHLTGSPLPPPYPIPHHTMPSAELSIYSHGPYTYGPCPVPHRTTPSAELSRSLLAPDSPMSVHFEIRPAMGSISGFNTAPKRQFLTQTCDRVYGYSVIYVSMRQAASSTSVCGRLQHYLCQYVAGSR